jgi:dTDP-glucose pyrophosphorylase/CBS domain-containing protein
MKAEVERHLVSLECSIRDALVRIDRNGQGIVFVADPERHLLGTISDGDVRRAMLRGVQLDDLVERLLDSDRSSAPKTISAPAGTSDADLLQKMNEHGVRQIPIVSADGQIIDLAFLSELVKNYELPLRAVIMAGGYGTRLRPLTDKIPKPMLPVGGRPLLQRTIEQLKEVGVRHINVATHYKADVIIAHFGDGHEFGVEIEYLREAAPLGTAGALLMVKACDDPLLIINGDILTQVNFRAMLEYHRAHKAWLTVGVRQYDVQVPYGVLECDGATVTRVSEKPKMTFFVNAGIYVVEPAVRSYIQDGCRFDMTDLIERLVADRCPVVGFPIAEYWLDVGSPMDYEQAQQDVMNGRIPS